MRGVTFLVLLMAALAAPAQAQPAAPNITGVWGFETESATDWRCVISGRAQVRAAARNRYDIQMQAVQHCEAFADQDVRTEQTCTATQELSRLTLDCRLITQTEQEYLPDNFTLEIKSGALMEGLLVSGWVARAQWRRDGDALTS